MPRPGRRPKPAVQTFGQKHARVEESVSRRALMVPEILAHIVDFAIAKPLPDDVAKAQFDDESTIIGVDDTPWPFMLRVQRLARNYPSDSRLMVELLRFDS